MAIEEGKLVRSDHTKFILINSLTHQIYTKKDTLQSTTDAKKYYIPIEKNNATFDAFC